MEIKNSEKINEFNGCSLLIATYSPDFIVETAKKTQFKINNNLEKLFSYISETNTMNINDEKLNHLVNTIFTSANITEEEISHHDLYQIFLNTLFLKEIIAGLYLSSKRIREEKPIVSESLLFSLGYCFTFGISRDDFTDQIIALLAKHLGNGNPGYKFWKGWDSHGIQLRFLELLFCYNGNIKDLKHIKSIRDIAIVLLHPIIEQLNIKREIDDIWEQLSTKINNY